MCVIRISFLYLLTCTLAFSQNNGGGQIPPPLVPESNLRFDAPERTPLGATGTVMTADYSCAEDGSVFVQIADAPKKWH